MKSGPDVLKLWTIYKHPKDYPDQFVARCWLLDKPTEFVLLGRTLDDVRSLLPPGLYPMDRSPGDDPCIVETWI